MQADNFSSLIERRLSGIECVLLIYKRFFKYQVLNDLILSFNSFRENFNETKNVTKIGFSASLSIFFRNKKRQIKKYCSDKIILHTAILKFFTLMSSRLLRN
ncbi:hypothetical protein BpHYR1_010692 [Brachionus plicatilis]|uniref:Uncharacterized protein n=1 Tax=Brachionus plicatilis TaxID=10195 RepID=A0A3M7SVU9_BRAPC|nr:hypothetical protein BpHYR1_010692 [Brachionus plicatilis]